MSNPHTQTQTFTGKKLDNFIEISNDAKNTVHHNNGRPNVSMETLKRKKNMSGK